MKEAQLGIYTDPAIKNEIAEIRVVIDRLRAKVKKGKKDTDYLLGDNK